MIPQALLQQYIQSICQQPELYGVIIGLQGNGTCRVLREGVLTARNFTERIVIIEELEGPRSPAGRVVEVRAGGGAAAGAAPAPVNPAAAITLNRSRLRSEFVGMGLSCGAMVLAGAGAAAASLTVVGVVAWVGFLTAAAQCVNGAIRYSEARNNPTTNSLERWDNNTTYHYVWLAVDGAGILSGGIQLAAGGRALLQALRQYGTMEAELAQMTRAAQQDAIRRAVENAGRSEEGRLAVRRALQSVGLTRNQAGNLLGARTTQAAMTSAAAERLANALQAIAARFAQAPNVAAAALSSTGDFAGAASGILMSGAPASRVGCASGSVNELIVNPILIHVLNQPPSQ